MTAMQELPTVGPIARYEQSIIERISDFNDPRQKRPLRGSPDFGVRKSSPIGAGLDSRVLVFAVRAGRIGEELRAALGGEPPATPGVHGRRWPRRCLS